MNEIENKIYFSDVIGYDKEKEELKEIQNFIVNLQRYEEKNYQAIKTSDNLAVRNFLLSYGLGCSGTDSAPNH